MKQERIQIGNIPAVCWGQPSSRIILAVHGSQSCKTDPVIQILAEKAEKTGRQVLSFDLPGHGERKEEGIPCKVQFCLPDLQAVMKYAKGRWAQIGLFACSLGAYFSLLAYREEPLRQCLFLSPVVDMRRLIENMMAWFQVTPKALEAKGEVPTPMGETLYWDYYSYVKSHPIDQWDSPTAILYGENDTLCEHKVLLDFVKKFHASLEVAEQGEHYFHTPKQMERYENWLDQFLSS